MKIILLQSIPRLGSPGDIKDVAPSYARNVLLKNNLVIIATQENIKLLEQKKVRNKKQKIQTKTSIKKMADTLKGLTLSISASANEKGKLFAGIDAKKIAQELGHKNGLNINPEHIKLKKPIKQTGEYNIEFKISSDFKGKFKVNIKN